MKINTLLLLSAVAAIALANPIPSSERALYRRDRFRRQVPDLTQSLGAVTNAAKGATDTAMGATKGLPGVLKRGVQVNGQDPVSGATDLAGNLLKPTNLAARQLEPVTGALGTVTNTAMGTAGGLLPSASKAEQPASADTGIKRRQLPDLSQPLGAVTNAAKGATDTTMGATNTAMGATKGLPGVLKRGVQVNGQDPVSGTTDLAGNLLKPTNLAARQLEPVTGAVDTATNAVKGLAGGLPKVDQLAARQLDAVDPIVNSAKDLAGSALSSASGHQA